MSDSEKDIVYEGADVWAEIADSDKVVLGSFDCKIFRSENINLDRIFIFVIFFMNHRYIEVFNYALYFKA